MSLLLCLAKFRLLDLLPSGSIVISKFKIFDYGATTKRQLLNYPQIEQQSIDDLELFESWRSGKNLQLSDGDLSTIYIAMKNPPLIVLTSDDDLFLSDICDRCGVHHKKWDEVMREIADERTLELYKLIKISNL
ncbi:hypothetical protein [Chitinophaga sp. OAE865]|uniref:hypothetical protein n=1 Tax=Chitinophaga sp. OAE865 TaxID=2817898 RepID=UPI001AE6C7FA